eukprot:1158761-Pelagomonas_calceolata.AAC.3
MHTKLPQPDVPLKTETLTITFHVPPETHQTHISFPLILCFSGEAPVLGHEPLGCWLPEKFEPGYTGPPRAAPALKLSMQAKQTIPALHSRLSGGDHGQKRSETSFVW